MGYLSFGIEIRCVVVGLEWLGILIVIFDIICVFICVMLGNVVMCEVVLSGVCFRCMKRLVK